MKQKLIEIRDSGTCITAIAIKTEAANEFEEHFFGRGGWSNSNVVLIKCNGETRANYDPFDWRADGSRTMFEAHRYIVEHFDELEDYALVDVQYILGETDQIKKSDIL